MTVYIAVMLLLNAVRFGTDSEKQRELKISLPESLDYDGLFDDLLDQSAFFGFESKDFPIGKSVSGRTLKLRLSDISISLCQMRIF